MSLAFRIVRFTVEYTPQTKQWEGEGTFDFPDPIRIDRKRKPVVDVALRSFELQFMASGNRLEYYFSQELVNLDISTTEDHGSGTVKAKALLAVGNPAAVPHFHYQGHIEALVIADLDDAK